MNGRRFFYDIFIPTLLGLLSCCFPGCAMTAEWVRKYGPALLVSVGMTVAMLPLQTSIHLSNTALLYVLMVVVVGSRLGRGPAIVSAITGALLYAHVFVPPLFTLPVTELQYHLLAAGVMLVVALLVGHLTASLKSKAEEIQQRETQARALYGLARSLAASLNATEIERVTGDFLQNTVNARDVCLLMRDSSPPRPDAPGRPGYVLMRLPLQAANAMQSELCCAIPASQAGTPALRELLDTTCSVVAVALERAHFAEMSREHEVGRAAESLRSSILAALSHDLRTPLTVLVGMADSLALGKGSPERQRSMLDALREQALQINQQVTNLLDMAKLRSGKLERHEAWQPVEEVIGATLQQVRSQWRSREITVDIAPSLPPLCFDAVLIERALWNLLENAIKYSPPETPVELVVRQQGEWVDIGVYDWGPGLPPDGIEHLFGLFCRGHAESNIAGVGLGLAIARGMAEAHGGTILADNRLGGGACFRLRLPVGVSPCLTELEDEA